MFLCGKLASETFVHSWFKPLNSSRDGLGLTRRFLRHPTSGALSADVKCRIKESESCVNESRLVSLNIKQLFRRHQ